MSKNSVNPPIIAIIGQTASGKSALALKLAQKFNGAVISADSQQIYTQSKIGTNQPVGEWLKANSKWKKITGKKQLYFVAHIPHFFIDTLSPNKQYSAAQFQAKTNQLCRKLSTNGILPIIAGGTGLYVSSVIESYKFPKGKANTYLRNRLNKLSTIALQQKLKNLDLVTWLVIDKTNRRRLIRALEHVITTGQSFSANQQKNIRPNTLIIGLKINKTTLRQAIIKRTDKMLRRGLIKEVEHLQKKYPRSPLLQSISYREVASYLNSQINKSECRQQIINHTWQYSRRQLTWFKRMPNVNWINNPNKATILVKQFQKHMRVNSPTWDKKPG